MPWGACATARWATSSERVRRDQQVAGLAVAGKGGGDHHLGAAEGARRRDEAGIVGDAAEIAAGEEGQLEAVRGEDIGGGGELPDRFADLFGNVEPPAVADHGIAEHQRGRSGFAQPVGEADRRLDLGGRAEIAGQAASDRPRSRERLVLDQRGVGHDPGAGAVAGMPREEHGGDEHHRKAQPFQGEQARPPADAAAGDEAVDDNDRRFPGHGSRPTRWCTPLAEAPLRANPARQGKACGVGAAR